MLHLLSMQPSPILVFFLFHPTVGFSLFRAFTFIVFDSAIQVTKIWQSFLLKEHPAWFIILNANLLCPDKFPCDIHLNSNS